MTIAAVGSIGTGFSGGTAGSFLTFNTALPVRSSVNEFVIMTIATDNLGTVDGATNTHTSVTGGTGTWTKIAEYTDAQGAALAGTTVSVWYFEPSADNATNFQIRANWSASITDSAISGHVFTHNAGNKIREDATATRKASQLTNAVNYTSQTFSGLSSKERLWFRGLAKEVNQLANVTPSSGYTALTGRRSQAAATAQLSNGEFSIATATGSTSAPTGINAGDTAELFIAFEEYTPSVTRHKPRASYLY